MAIYHLAAQILSRSKGRSCIAAAAYRAGEKIREERTGLIHDYTRKPGIDYKEILAPEQVPGWIFIRDQLWNQVDAAEKRKDAQTAREINIALPRELTREENIELVRTYVNDNFVKHGMVADLAIHMNDPENPHAHVMLTTRSISMEGFGAKNRDWNRVDFLELWRENWQEYANQALTKARVDERIDHRSHQARGIEQVPTVHEGPAVRAMEKRGIRTKRGDLNREAVEINQEIKELTKAQIVAMEEYKKLREELQAEKDKWYYFKPEEKRAVLLAKDTLGQYADMASVRQGLADLNLAIKELENNNRAIAAAETPYINANHLLGKIQNYQAKIDKMGFKDRHFGKGKLQYKQVQENIEKAKRNLHDLGFSDKNDLDIKWAEFAKLKEAQLNKIQETRIEINKTAEILKAAEKAFTLAEKREAALQYQTEVTPRAFLGLEYEQAKAINDLNKEMERVLSLNEIKDLAKKGNLLRDDSQRLERAAAAVNDYEDLQEQIERLESPVQKAKRMVSNKAQGEYQDLLNRANKVLDTMRTNGVLDRTDLNLQKQENYTAINHFPMAGTGFLKALEVFNRAAQGADRAQVADRYAKFRSDREIDEERRNKERGYGYER